MWRERTGGALAMNEKGAKLSIHPVLLNLQQQLNERAQISRRIKGRKGVCLCMCVCEAEKGMSGVSGRHEQGSKAGQGTARANACQHLCNVVGDVINDMHVKVFWSGLELLCKRLASQEGHGASVHPRVICSGRHACQVVLPFL